MRITMLGTGHAMVSECYNTCFLLTENDRNFLVDGGGGNTILRQLKYAGYRCSDISDIFVTHKHIDHLLGVIWVIRTICQSIAQGITAMEVNVYAHEELIGLIGDLLEKLLWREQWKKAGGHIHFIAVEDGGIRNILGRNTTFFDIGSVKEKQFGFCMELDSGKKLTCCGDESFHPCAGAYVENSEWLMHEAYCLYSQADLFSPYEKHHSTVKEACETAERFGVKNLILYHTEDRNLKERKKLYGEEGSRYFHGKLYIPDDLEVISI